jgi:phosphoglycerate dehydrogenase-like enzyme
VGVRVQRRRTNVAVAEHSMALMLALAKQLPLVGGRVTPQRLAEVGHSPARYDRRHTANSNWGRFGGLRTLAGATLGLVGLGEIGREVAAMARGLGMHVLYTQRTRLDPAREAEFGVTYACFDELLAESDYISLHVPMNENTRDMFGEETFARMKPGAILINTARAAIVNREALLGALRSGRLGGAGFDVLYEEPAGEDDPLLDLDNVILTPHLAGAGRFNGVNDIVDIIMAIQDLPRR